MIETWHLCLFLVLFQGISQSPYNKTNTVQKIG